MEAEETLSIPDHGRTWVGLQADGRTQYAKFVFDLAGRLIYRVHSPNDDDFGPEAQWLAFREDARMPQPWHWSRKEFLRDLGGWIEQAPAGIREDFRKLYPRQQPDVVDSLFIPEAHATGRNWSAEQLCRVLDAAEARQASEHRAWQAMQRLDGFGVARLPALERFDPRYHEIEGEPPTGAPVTQVSPGYGFNRKVLRRAKVQLETQ